MPSLPSLITLTGFMGTGKTSVGRALARLLHYDFLDSDREIESKEARSIPQIFEKEGEAYFRKVEKEMIAQLSSSGNRVLSIGGGAILNSETFKLLHERGVVILLKATANEIARRLGHENERPLLAGGDRKKKILALMKERAPVYEKIQLQVDTTGLAIDEVVAKTLKLLR